MDNVNEQALEIHWGELVCENCGDVIKRTGANQHYCKTCSKLLNNKSRIKATTKYSAKAYERIELRVKKGYKQVVTSHAAAQGESVNQFINRAMANQIQSDTEKK